MLTIREYKKVQSLEEAWELNQKRANRVIGGMMWMRLGDSNFQTAMTIPAVFYATNWWAGAAAGLIVAVIFALKEKGLTVVAIAACVAVFVVELFH